MATDPIDEVLSDVHLRLGVEERFWPKVMRPMDWTSCWEWQGAKRRLGYGRFKTKSYTTVSAHRLSYALYYGVSPGEMHVCHRCDNPQCVNPEHLFLGTNADNVADKVTKGRAIGRDQRGERNAAAKLTARAVDEIRDLISAGHKNTHIAARYGVTHQLISRIRRGRSWVVGMEGVEPPTSCV